MVEVAAKVCQDNKHATGTASLALKEQEEG